jgi:hypothetical protein
MYKECKACGCPIIPIDSQVWMGEKEFICWGCFVWAAWYLYDTTIQLIKDTVH